MKKRAAYMPTGPRWYLADLVEAISVGRRRLRTVHLNTVLVRAASSREAYSRALELGRKETNVRPKAKLSVFEKRPASSRASDYVDGALRRKMEDLALIAPKSRNKRRPSPKLMRP